LNTRTQPLQGASPPLQTAAHTRWIQLGLGLVCMMTISSPQYVWTLMTKPLMAKLGIALPELQVTFSLLVLLQAFFSPFQGALIDRFGPRMLISIGTVLAGASWVLASYAQSTSMLYLTYGVIGGLGTGIVYVGVIGFVVRWFPDRRGFAAGVAAAGYGMGAIVTTFPIAASLATRGVESTLWLYGIIFALAALPLALTIDRFTNGLTRPLFGWISDRLGRENTMCFAFALEGVAMALWLMTRDNAVLFVLLSGVVFFGWGEIFSLFPSTLTDTFGTRYATANYGWLYISFGIGSIFGGPLAALLHQHTGSWVPVFGAAIVLDLSTAVLAMFVLKPARARFVGAQG
jgi:MFS family permease